MDISYSDELLAAPERIRCAIGENASHELLSAQKLIFCGCGTSYYLGAQCALICNVNGRVASAVDAVDILSCYTLPEADAVYVFVSRSGNSEETVRAAMAVKERGAASFYLGCTPGSRLDRICDVSRVLPYGNEKLILESYSYYVQMAGALRCCGIIVDEGLPKLMHKALEDGREFFSRYWKDMKISRIISLASPFYRPLHREMMLKDGEITQLPSEEWGILEFRHGPRCWCDETTLIHIVSEQTTRQWDLKVAEELIGYGCPVIWYGKDAPKGCFNIDYDVAHRSAAEVLLFGAFHTSIAVETGRSRGTTPEKLKHIVYNVGGL